ncbi:MAG TPA: hypothetical protein VH325_13945 [Bryobacteraceae bacterium]|jgi:hypothetical protein|nr:hypothetical protein [Bryobacteraceae bacterium]
MIRSLFILFSLLAGAATADQLTVGEPLPMLSGHTVSGKLLELPSAAKGSNRVLVFSFAKSASADSRAWSQHLVADADPSSPVISYRVIVLESVPKLFRGMAVSGIKSGVPQALWDTTVLLYQDEALWKKRLAVTADDRCYIVLLDGEGRLRWVSPGPFSNSAYGRLKEAVSHIRGR